LLQIPQIVESRVDQPPEKSPKDWSDGEVVVWASRIIKPEHANKLKDQEVDGEALSEMVKNEGTTKIDALLERWRIPGGQATILAPRIRELFNPSTTQNQAQAPAQAKAVSKPVIEETEKGTFFKFQDHPLFDGTLYVRPCYEDLFFLIQKEKNERVLILGNPGIGKTCFNAFLFVKLKQIDVKNIIYVRKTTLAVTILFFSGDQVQTFSTLDPLRQVLSDPETWFLLDTVPDPGEWKARMVNVSSPKRENYKQYQKYPKVVTYYMPVWSYDEFEVSAKVFPSVGGEVFHKKFLLFGGIPRLIFFSERR